MKVAVSIPDPVFAEAEQLAREWQTTRSHLYARALSEFIGAHAPDRITKALDEGLSDDDELRDFRRAAAKRVFDRIEW